MDPIGTFSGLASGIQWRDMVDQIMRLEAVRRVDPLKNQATAAQRRVEAWGQFRSLVAKFNTASKALQSGSAFDGFRASGGTTPAGRALFAATAGSGAVPASTSVEVLALARAEKLGSNPRADAATPLGLSGASAADGAPLPLRFAINGQQIEVAPDASLNAVRDAINRANTGANATGVSATVLSTGPAEHRLILTADRTGAAGIRLQDGDDGALAQLGFGTASRSAALSGALDEPAPPLAAILGLSAPPQQRTVVIDGHEVQVDLANDTLQTLLNKVHAAGLHSARVVAEPGAGGETVHRLEVPGSVVGKLADADTRAVLDALGFTRPNGIATGADSHVRLDGFDLTRRSNTVSDALTGISITLQAAEPGTVVDLSVARDGAKTVDAVRAFAAAYNELTAFVRQQGVAGQPLAGNGTLRNAMSQMTGTLLTDLADGEGATFAFKRATLVGVSLSRDGTLAVDEARLSQLLESSAADVRTLFTGFPGGPEGLGARFTRVTDAMIQTGDGLIAGQTESLQRSIDALGTRASDAESRLALRREAMIRQFTRMEEALSRFQSQGTWLSSQIRAMQPQQR